MHVSSTLHALDPLERFREIYEYLNRDNSWWNDSAWFRYAAQAAVMRPASPEKTAHEIREMAAKLQAHAHWYDALSSPFTLVVAATLVQIGDTAEAFDAEVDSARRMLREAGFHHDGMHQLGAILALRVLSDGRSASYHDIARMRLIYRQMKSHHWWLTGGDDLPACALLSRCLGTPAEIAGVADGVYQLLCDHGFKRSNHLHAAANLLPLAGLPAADAAFRFTKLSEAFGHFSISLWTDRYDAIALAALLDHDPDRIAKRIDEISLELESLEPGLIDDANFNVAVDLAYLDLARFDRQMRRLSEPGELEHAQSLIRLQRAASVTLVAVPPTPIALGNGWPIGI
jgi:hypothetical protein